jgi:hypothetical protein
VRAVATYDDAGATFIKKNKKEIKNTKKHQHRMDASARGGEGTQFTHFSLLVA